MKSYKWVSMYNVLRFIYNHTMHYLEVLFSDKCECGKKMVSANVMPIFDNSHPYICVNPNHDRDIRDKKLKKLLK